MYETGGSVAARPLVHDETVYIGSQDGFVYALDAENGDMRWKYDVGVNVLASVSASGRLVVMADSGGVIHALDRHSGKSVWLADYSDEKWADGISLSNVAAFVVSESGSVKALDIDTGVEMWTFEAGSEVNAGLTADGGSVFFTSRDTRIYSLDAKTGELRWKTELYAGSLFPPTAAQGLVVVSTEYISDSGLVYALDAKTGAHVWHLWTTGPLSGAARVSGDAAFFGSEDGYAYSVSIEDGSLNWRNEVGEGVLSTPSQEWKLVYIASEHALFALDKDTGDIVWEFEIAEGITSPAVVKGVRVYAGSSDGLVYALVGGFSDGYTHTPVAVEESLAEPQFEPLSKSELETLVNTSFQTSSPVLGTVSIYGPSGKVVEHRDRSELVIEIVENGYYLLTGRTLHQGGFDLVFLSTDDYYALADERGNPGLKQSIGWCCIRTETGLELIMRGGLSQDTAVTVTAHEVGHALQRIQNPTQMKWIQGSMNRAMLEAQAYTLEVALMRKIGEYLNMETARWPTGYLWGEYLDRWREALKASAETPQALVHYRGRLIMWQAVLHDPELKHLRRELERNGHVSADSLMDMYYKFIGLAPSEIDPYIESITQGNLSDDLNFIFGTVYKRVDHTRIEFPDLVLNVPGLVISP